MKTYVARRAYQVQTYVVWFGNKSGSVQGEDSPRKGFIRNTQTENPPPPNSTKLHNDQSVLGMNTTGICTRSSLLSLIMYSCVQASFSIGPTAPTYFQQSETDVGPILQKVVSVEQQS